MSATSNRTSSPPVATPTGLRRYIVVISHRTIRWAFLGSLIARLTQTMVPLALLLFARQQLGGFGGAGTVVAIYALTASFGFPVIGRMVDRRGPSVLIVAAIINAAGIIAIVMAPTGLIWPLAAIAGVSTPPLGAAIRSVFVRGFDRPSDQASAMSLDTIGTELMFISGPALVAALVALASPKTGLLLAVVVSLIGTGLFAATAGRAKNEPTRAGNRSRGLWSLVPLLLIVAMQMSAIGFIEVAIIARAIELNSASAAGVLLAIWAAGSVVGGLTFGARDWPGSVQKQCGVLLGLTALGFCTLVIGHNLAVLYPLMFLAGLAVSPSATTLATICGRLAPPHNRTEAFTWLASATGLGGAGGYALGGVLVSHTNAVTAFLTGAAIPVLAVVLVLALPTRRLSGATDDDTEDNAPPT
ncbi:MFS transporter [Phytomonospora endophytica]|uniref:MFS family permease n=1 Tax=Phytomonospora endophytica TaxID=714109 RepID=A0A841FSA5_9ACTN|nr:MFS transporter [Phytomonospora endophytica]MBB6038684.1 MFS family permease [Phytomonospora endophytica]GIG69171.1 MFS transporter [Phytomonospora endophytica]